MLLYKVTSHGDSPWLVGETRAIAQEMRSLPAGRPNVLIAYRDPRLAALTCGLLASDAHAWEVDVPLCVLEDDAAVGSWEMTLLREIRLPSWYPSDRHGLLILAGYLDAVFNAIRRQCQDVSKAVRGGLECSSLIVQYGRLMLDRDEPADAWCQTLLGLAENYRNGEDVSFGISRLLILLSNAYTQLTNGLSINHTLTITSAI